MPPPKYPALATASIFRRTNLGPAFPRLISMALPGRCHASQSALVPIHSSSPAAGEYTMPQISTARRTYPNFALVFHGATSATGHKVPYPTRYFSTASISNSTPSPGASGTATKPSTGVSAPPIRSFSRVKCRLSEGIVALGIVAWTCVPYAPDTPKPSPTTCNQTGIPAAAAMPAQSCARSTLRLN